MKRGKKEMALLKITNIEQHLKYSKTHISGISKHQLHSYEFDEIEEIIDEVEKNVQQLSKKTIQ